MSQEIEIKISEKKKKENDLYFQQTIDYVENLIESTKEQLGVIVQCGYRMQDQYIMSTEFLCISKTIGNLFYLK